jgi:hypothetical protein
MSCIFSMLYISSKSSSTVNPPFFIHMAKHPSSCTYTQNSCVKQSTLQVIQLLMCKFYCLGSVCCSRVCFFPTRDYTVKNCLEFLFFYHTFLTLERTYADTGFLCYSKKGIFAVLPFWPLDPTSGMSKKSRSGSRIRILIFHFHNIFPKNRRNKDIGSLGILISWLLHKFRSLKILGPPCNLKIQQ